MTNQAQSINLALSKALWRKTRPELVLASPSPEDPVETAATLILPGPNNRANQRPCLGRSAPFRRATTLSLIRQTAGRLT